jgi:hypothetical protein
MEAILVASIGAVGIVLAALIQVMRKENSNDHAVVADSLNRIEVKIDSHINDHVKGEI